MAAITSTATGNWSAGGTWVGGIAPVAGDTVTIANTHVVTVDDTARACLSLSITGTVYFSRTASSQLIVGDGATAGTRITVNNGGILDMGTQADPITAAYTATLIIDPSVTSNSAGVVAYGGALRFWGDPTYNAVTKTVSGYTTGTYDTTLSSDAAAGQKNLVLTADLGLRAGGGDTIVIAKSAQTNGYAAQNEVMTTASYNAGTKTITLTVNLAFAHKAGGYLFNATRNVKIQSNNNTRIAGFNGTASGATPMASTWGHFEAKDFGTFAGTTNTVIAFGSIAAVGMSFWTSVAAPSAASGFSAIWNGITAINCFLHWASFNGASNPSTFTNCGGIQAVGNGTIQQVGQLTVTNCWFAGCVTYCTSINNIGTVTNCVFAESRFAMGVSNLITANSCTFSYLSQATDSGFNNQFNSCTYSHLDAMCYNSNNELIQRNCTWTSVTAALQFPNLASQTTHRPLREQNGTNGTRCNYEMGTLTQYVTATSPEAVFPLPSSSTYVGKLTGIGSNIATNPITIRSTVAVAANTTFTFTVNVYPLGWGASLPTAANLYLSLTGPGIATALTSVQNISANGQWNALTVTGTATSAGDLVCDLYIACYVLNATLYVDFPLGFQSDGLVWHDGIPSETLTLISSGVASDVWNQLSANVKTAGSMGVMVENIKALTVLNAFQD